MFSFRYVAGDLIRSDFVTASFVCVSDQKKKGGSYFGSTDLMKSSFLFWSRLLLCVDKSERAIFFIERIYPSPKGRRLSFVPQGVSFDR